ncbi:hypothetical protein LguiA_023947 [Lonicera macranthoides]
MEWVSSIWALIQQTVLVLEARMAYHQWQPIMSFKVQMAIDCCKVFKKIENEKYVYRHVSLNKLLVVPWVHGGQVRMLLLFSKNAKTAKIQRPYIAKELYSYSYVFEGDN